MRAEQGEGGSRARAHTHTRRASPLTSSRNQWNFNQQRLMEQSTQTLLLCNPPPPPPSPLHSLYLFMLLPSILQPLPPSQNTFVRSSLLFLLIHKRKRSPAPASISPVLLLLFQSVYIKTGSSSLYGRSSGNVPFVWGLISEFNDEEEESTHFCISSYDFYFSPPPSSSSDFLEQKPVTVGITKCHRLVSVAL